MNKNNRLIEIFNTENNVWEFTNPLSVKKGDKFRMYEPDMTPIIDDVTGLHEHIAFSDMYIDPLQRYTVQFVVDE